jgi:methylenetetrahydrofolate dehydrogenase (NADP+)/methenyltetrahydrofolate cyclohydrolase
LAFVRVGEDPASKVYVGMKERASARLGIHSVTTVLNAATSQAELLALLTQLNTDPCIHGILVQAPLPAHFVSAAVYSAVRPEKDVDGFHPMNVGKLLLADPSGFAPCTPAGVQQLLIRSQVSATEPTPQLPSVIPAPETSTTTAAGPTLSSPRWVSPSF